MMKMDKKAVIVNPHDDDGIIAIGGTIIQLLNKGWKIKYIQMTDGRHGSNIMPPEKTKIMRAKEIKNETNFLNIDSYVSFDLEDGNLDKLKDKTLVKRLEKEISSYKPLAVFIPSECEDHSDYRATYEMAHEAMKKFKDILEIRYSVWSIPFKEHKPHPFEKLIISEISEEMDKKREAIKLHVSQEKEGHYSNMVDRTNSYLALLYSAYKPYKLEKAEILAITKINNKYNILEDDLRLVKDVTETFHGRSSKKIKS